MCSVHSCACEHSTPMSTFLIFSESLSTQAILVHIHAYGPSSERWATRKSSIGENRFHTCIHVKSNDMCCIAWWVWNFQGGSRWSMWQMLRARNNHVSHILRTYILCTSYESEIRCKEETKRTSWQMVCWRQPSFLLSQKTVSHSLGGETLLCVSTQQFHLQDCANLYVLSSWLICAKNKIELFCPR